MIGSAFGWRAAGSSRSLISWWVMAVVVLF